MVAAVCSAILFERLPHWRIGAGLLGIVAAITAVAVYFMNQWTTEEEAQDPAGESQGHTTSMTATTVAGEPAATRSTAAAESQDPTMSSMAADFTAYSNIYWHEEKRPGSDRAGIRLSDFRNAQVWFNSSWIEAAYEEEHETLSSIDAAVDIVTKLSLRRGTDYEVVIHPDGRLTVKPADTSRVEVQSERRSSWFSVIHGGKRAASA
jgi:hypothetical protein